jgi:hypothetical protein
MQHRPARHQSGKSDRLVAKNACFNFYPNNTSESGKALREFVQENGYKYKNAAFEVYLRSGGYRHAIENV